MTDTINRYGIYEPDHTKFGGFIYSSDFNTDNRDKNNYSGSPIANHIARDTQFDKQCKKSAIARRNNKTYAKQN